MVVLYKSIGNHSNRLLQHASLSVFCSENRLRFLDLNEYRLLPPRKSPPRPGPLKRWVHPMLSVAVQALAKARLVHAVDLSREGAADILREDGAGIKLLFVAGWGFSAPEALKRQRARISAKFAAAVPHEWEGELAGKPSLGIHIRRGDYAEYDGGRFFYSDRQYIDLTKRAVAALGLADPRILIFTNDDALDLKAYEGAFPDCILSREAYYVDHALMAKCDYLLGPPSTFTQWASYIGSVPLLAVYDPESEIVASSFKIFPETA